jgi:phage shock protein A
MSMGNLSPAQAAITAARNEIAREKLEKGVARLKAKLRELDAAETVVANIKREIADLELQIEQGNV